MTAKRTQWEYWFDEAGGYVFCWHPDDDAPAGTAFRISPAIAESIRDQSGRREGKTPC